MPAAVREGHEDRGDLAGDRTARFRRVACHRASHLPAPPAYRRAADRRHSGPATLAGAGLCASLLPFAGSCRFGAVGWPGGPRRRRCPSGTASTRPAAHPRRGAVGRRCATTSSTRLPRVPARPDRRDAARGAHRRPRRPDRHRERRSRRGRCCGSTATCPTRCRCRSTIDVVHRDDDIVVVDKPHFLATIPRGRHVVETALVRLRRELGLPELSPAHRLDRVTAGLLLFVVRPRAARDVPDAVPRPAGAQGLRGGRAARPGVAAAARRAQPHRQGAGRHHRAARCPARRTPRRWSSCVEHRGGLAPLPAHARSPGAPTSSGCTWRRSAADPGGPVLPRVREPKTPLDDFTRPLQLLAATLEFPDPATGELRRFTSRRSLQAWTDPAAAGPRDPDRPGLGPPRCRQRRWRRPVGLQHGGFAAVRVQQSHHAAMTGPPTRARSTAPVLSRSASARTSSGSPGRRARRTPPPRPPSSQAVRVIVSIGAPRGVAEQAGLHRGGRLRPHHLVRDPRHVPGGAQQLVEPALLRSSACSASDVQRHRVVHERQRLVARVPDPLDAGHVGAAGTPSVSAIVVGGRAHLQRADLRARLAAGLARGRRRGWSAPPGDGPWGARSGCRRRGGAPACRARPDKRWPCAWWAATHRAVGELHLVLQPAADRQLAALDLLLQAGRDLEVQRERGCTGRERPPGRAPRRSPVRSRDIPRFERMSGQTVDGLSPDDRCTFHPRSQVTQPRTGREMATMRQGGPCRCRTRRHSSHTPG